MKEFKNFDDDVLNAALQAWDKETGYTLGDSQRRAPVAGGFLIRSAIQKKAFISNTGIASKIIYTVPYAEKLNDLTYLTPSSNKIDLKEEGKISYKVDGMIVKKKKKGELGFLDLAVEDSSQKGRFTKAAGDAISKAWKLL